MTFKNYIEVCIRQLCTLLNSNGTLYAGSTNSPNIEKSNTNLDLLLNLNLPLKSVWPPPPYPLHTASPARSCPPRRPASQTASCTPLRLTAPLRSHLLCTSRGKSEARGTADPAADSRPIPSPSRAETTCSWGWRGPSSRSARRSPNSACEPLQIATFLARTWRNRPRR